jgi:hypothetical protein
VHEHLHQGVSDDDGHGFAPDFDIGQGGKSRLAAHLQTRVVISRLVWLEEGGAIVDRAAPHGRVIVEPAPRLADRHAFASS